MGTLGSQEFRFVGQRALKDFLKRVRHFKNATYLQKNEKKLLTHNCPTNSHFRRFFRAFRNLLNPPKHRIYTIWTPQIQNLPGFCISNSGFPGFLFLNFKSAATKMSSALAYITDRPTCRHAHKNACTGH